MISVKKLYRMRKHVSALAFTSFLLGTVASSSWAMEDEDSTKGEIRGFVSAFSHHLKETSEIPDAYDSTGLKSITSTYETKVSLNEWKKAREDLWKYMEIFLEGPTKFRKSTNEFVDLYNLLNKDFRGALQIIRRNPEKFFWDVLFNFIVDYQPVSSKLKETFENEKSDLNEITKTFQKGCNLFMKAWEELTGEEASLYGELKFSKIHAGVIKHLYYVRDSHGFIIYTLFPCCPISENLSVTYISHGMSEPDNSFRRMVFSERLPSDEGYKIIRDSGILISQKEGNLSVMPYTGAEGPVPFITGKNIRMIENKILPSHIRDSSSMGKKAGELIYSLKDFLLAFLGDAPCKLFAVPNNQAEHLEVELDYLKDVQDRQQANPEDPDVVFSLDYIEKCYPDKPLEDLIANHEAVLEKLYVAEEEAILAEQEQQRKRVVEGEPAKHALRKTRGGKGNRKGKRSFRSVIESKKKIDQSEMNIRARAAANKRMVSLRQVDPQKPIKYGAYLKMVNIAIQEFRRLGIPVTGALNGSSHGSLTIGDQNYPICRPHGNRDTVSGGSAQLMFNNLLNQYFSTLAHKNAESGEK
ncbi:MAG: hypothetical protein BGO67_08390 [Alphaproteobacteria bacterium 41-28]|nr:MAG: hypothetical protein BGO67_08390 [Alphaproteobacteria bacterium 41-28]